MGAARGWGLPLPYIKGVKVFRRYNKFVFMEWGAVSVCNHKGRKYSANWFNKTRTLLFYVHHSQAAYCGFPNATLMTYFYMKQCKVALHNWSFFTKLVEF